ncbi:SAF domain-containing protein [Pimelobacter simplex]|uniref:SAF domain-containing protein n=1 Tax=Nocardioides simplex TaxID=2045 RepID=UPI0021504487|nr:SAF domain-containing protein [Pimelobacter simplex]UUW92482.1 SAF domain-containing protein [Pimelobacter simplex]UUW96310.1 SAF domain-containing protein [Pimelobacter simplex]
MTTTTNSDSRSESGRQQQAQSLLSGQRKAATGPLRPRERSMGLVILGALLVIGCGLGVAAWGLRAGDKTSVLAVGAPIAKGHVLERGDLVSVSVSGVDDAIPVENVDQVVGKAATVDIVEGEVLTEAMVTSSPVPGEGKAVIGLALEPTRVPGAGLQPGDHVDVIAVPSGDGAPVGGKDADAALDAPEVLATAAEVYEVGGDAVAGSQVLLTLIVDEGDASRVAAYSTQNRVAVVEIALTPDWTGGVTSSC